MFPPSWASRLPAQHPSRSQSSPNNNSNNSSNNNNS
eukprot:CAMPEP_0206455960 /NCGR_PEP_ID=MMETSP0324_2-20121206/22083_1 /ASSEMBLY_ACC=CAM_ASM_000836 /TAXON_ID=2866 /ORGANISM="Crypthecodinium cohnii, Strain Seligo" /LENGTH=35 /DNA_ID= /DNA_START= /DNA_END= /DNA_ORIENTATION=